MCNNASINAIYKYIIQYTCYSVSCCMPKLHPSMPSRLQVELSWGLFTPSPTVPPTMSQRQWNGIQHRKTMENHGKYIYLKNNEQHMHFLHSRKNKQTCKACEPWFLEKWMGRLYRLKLWRMWRGWMLDAFPHGLKPSNFEAFSKYVNLRSERGKINTVNRCI